MSFAEFGRALRTERIKHGIHTQVRFVEELGELKDGAVQISVSTICLVETGKRMVGPAVFDACARLFQWGPSEFRRMFVLAYRSAEVLAADDNAAWDQGVRR